MLKEERQNLILTILQQQGSVVAVDLSKQLQVSEDTIRRDLHELANRGQMTRVHGGALPHSPAGISYQERLQQSPAIKAAIARAALPIIQNGQTVFLDSGTTTLQLAALLPPHIRATIVTNSPEIAIELSKNPLIEIILIGGKLNKEMQVVTGTQAADAIRAIHADICFLGICSLDPTAGITVVDYDESVIKRAMIERSARVVALAGSEKLGTISPFQVASISSIDDLITEKDVSSEQVEAYQQYGVQVLLV